ncbi:unnamed protein product [Brassica rapa]|uniref:Uncharacterized protein n=1 Tax=Brassica campestris TaxID=3711 RepID=A0A8D9GCC8_BRACM|nr:unnamed protein product [Brassica rapa]
MDVLCVLNRQLTWAKITRTVHGKGQRAESKDQPTDVLCVLTDTHVHTLTHTDIMCVLTDTHGRPRTPTDVFPCGPKSPEQSTGRVSVLSPTTNVLICLMMDSHRRHVCADGHTQTHTDSHRRPVYVLCVLTDTHGRPVCADGHPQTSCVY